MLAALCMLFHPTPAQAAPSHNRLYVITMEYNGTDAMILESNGHFALIDTGEDRSSPDGHDPRYPLREGITVNADQAVDDRLFAVIQLLGIKKFDFIIGTHVHSDHIGNLPEVLNRYPVDKVFLKRYTDERIIWKEDLWDNLYGYDRVIEAAHKNNVRLIQDITAQDAHMKLGEMDIQLYNYENEWADQARGILKPVYDDNVNSIISVISVAGKRIYLGGDLQNFHGHEDKYGPIIGKVDFMKANHHNDCGQYTNTTGFINNLHPSIMLRTQPAPFTESFQKRLDEMKVKVYSAGRSDVPALAFDFSSAGGIQDLTEKVFSPRGFSQKDGRITYTKWDGNPMVARLNYANDRLYLFNPDGTVSTGWQSVNGKTYYFDPKNFGAALQGNHVIDGKTYHFDYYCRLKTGWIIQDGKWYYLDEAGVLLTNTTTPDGWTVDSQGVCVGKWMRNNTGWWWQLPDYSYASNQWLKIAGVWYRFDAKGYMITGWSKAPDAWYYLKPSGACAQDEWVYDNGWYYVDAEGKMCTGWTKVDNHWYYLSSSGLMQTGWVHTSTGWYYLSSNGSMLANTTTPDGWVVDDSGACIRSAGAWKRGSNMQWYYEFQHGGYPTNCWQSIDGVWYYFDQAGYAVTGWKKLGDTWYYFNDQCGMHTGWLDLNNKRYYLDKTGAMVVGNQVIDGKPYTFGADGALITSGSSSGTAPASPDNTAPNSSHTAPTSPSNTGNNTPNTPANTSSASSHVRSGDAYVHSESNGRTH